VTLVNGADKSPRGRPKPLSRREQMVLALISDGLANAEIAASLGLAPSTVKRYVASIMWKFEAHTRGEAVQEAIRLVGSFRPSEELRLA
jgi:DNA-binding NarL/FixJ family response regulator